MHSGDTFLKKPRMALMTRIRSGDFLERVRKIDSEARPRFDLNLVFEGESDDEDESALGNFRTRS